MADPIIYYVNTAADAGGDGTTQELTGEHCAFKTIAQVNAASPAAGDSILFNKGNTWREQLDVPTSGSEGSPITFGAYGEGVDPKVLGSDIITGWTAYEKLEINQATDNDFWTIGANCCQKLKITASYTVSKVSMYMYKATTGDAHIEFWTAGTGNAGATMSGDSEQIGGDSVVISIDQASATWFNFTWSSNNPTITADCFMHIVEESGDLKVRAFTPNAYEDTDYDLWNVGVDKDSDLTFKVYSVVTGVYFKENIGAGTDCGMVVVDGSTILQYNADKDVLAEGEYNHEIADDDLYIRLSGDADPSGYTIEADIRPRSIEVTNVDYITIENLYLGGGTYGLQILNGADYIIMQDNTLRYVASKLIKLQGDTAAITHCTIQNNDLRYAGGAGRTVTFSAFGIQVTGVDGGAKSTNNTVTQNLIQDTEKGAFLVRDADSNVFRYNESHGTGESCFWLQTADSNEVYYNIFDHDGDNDGDAVLYLLTGSLNNKIYNNVVISNGNDKGISIDGNCTGTICKNNIYYGSARAYYVGDGAESGIDLDYNCLYVTGGTFGTWRGVAKSTFADWQTDSSQDANSINSDPLMTDPANDNFYLQTTSPCKNTGTDVSLTEDYIGHPIIGNPDIGAYELQIISIGVGSYDLTGTAMSPLRDALLGIGAGSYSLTGTAVTLLRDAIIDILAGSYSLTGKTVTFVKTEAEQVGGYGSLGMELKMKM